MMDKKRLYEAPEIDEVRMDAQIMLVMDTSVTEGNPPDTFTSAESTSNDPYGDEK